MWTVLGFIVILGILILVHELGHLFSAIKLGVAVEEFGIGFPPRIFKIKHKGIIYSINWIPFGGFVKIKGESGETSNDPHSFVNQPVWKRSIILSAGVFMNFFLGFIILSIGFFVGLPQAIESNIPPANVRDRNTMIIEVLPDSPAAEVGLQVGDKVLFINDQIVTNSEFIYQFIQEHNREEFNITINRGSEDKVVSVKPRVIEADQPPIVGIGMVDTGIVSYGFFASLWQGLRNAVLMIGAIFKAFYTLLANLITTGKLDPRLSGPVGVAVITGQVVKLGWIYILQFTAVLSLNLGVLNILPLPALDGGRLLMVLGEKISRRRLNPRIEALIHNSGFILLIVLVIAITFRDFNRYGTQIWQGIKNIF